MPDDRVAEDDTPLMVSDTPDEDGQHLLFFLRNGATVKCGYVFKDAVNAVREHLQIEAVAGISPNEGDRA